MVSTADSKLSTVVWSYKLYSSLGTQVILFPFMKGLVIVANSTNLKKEKNAIRKELKLH